MRYTDPLYTEKTAIYGRVKQEYNMNPIDNPETAYLMAIRAQEQIQPKNTTQIIDRLTVTNNVVQAGTRQATEAFGAFIVSFPCPVPVSSVRFLVY